jgi:uncharacterized protein YeaO (DUF488 family)
MDINVTPAAESTVVVDVRTWRPGCLRDLKIEVEHIVHSAHSGADGGDVVLFRGQKDAKWETHSTFARNCKGIFDTSDRWYGNRIHQAYIDKFTKELGPSRELKSAERKHDIDPLFELMRRIQQHPSEFEGKGSIPGTNLLDWSRDVDVALAFAAEDHAIEGALLLFDTVACGRIFVEKSLSWVLRTMQQRLVDGLVNGLPQLYFPRRQLSYRRVDRQRPVYVAQMDLRYPIEHVLEMRERSTKPHLILRRLIITPVVKREIDEYLAACGRSRDWLLETESTSTAIAKS